MKGQKTINGAYEFEQLRVLKRAISRAKRYYIGKNVCLVSSLTARKILKNKGINSILYLGVLNEDEFKAHAWIEVDGYEIVNKTENFKVLYYID